MNDFPTTNSDFQDPNSVFPIPQSATRNPKLPSRHPILHEDAWLVAIHKPEGVLSHPNPLSHGKPAPRASRCAFEGSYDLDARRFDTPSGPIWLVHRLDQDTSGVLLAAKSEHVAKLCRVLFEEQQIHKIYFALVAGKPSPPSGHWRDHFQKQSGKGMVRSIIIPRRPPNAELDYKTLSTFPIPQSAIRNPKLSSLSLLKITLLTGRTHQIRVQAAAKRHFVAGDRVYGNFPLNRLLRQTMGVRRLCLHASSLQFLHPITRQPLVLEARLPDDMNDVLARLLEGAKKT